MRLTKKQELFCLEYAKSGNALNSYRLAFDNHTGKDTSIRVRASKLLNTDKIIVRLRDIEKETYERNRVKIDEVIDIMSKMLKFDTADLFDDDGDVKMLKDVTEEARLSITSISLSPVIRDGQVVGHKYNYKFIDRVRILELFLKYYNAYGDGGDSEEKPLMIGL